MRHYLSSYANFPQCLTVWESGLDQYTCSKDQRRHRYFSHDVFSVLKHYLSPSAALKHSFPAHTLFASIFCNSQQIQQKSEVQDQDLLKCYGPNILIQLQKGNTDNVNLSFRIFGINSMIVGTSKHQYQYILDQKHCNDLFL